MTFQAGQIIEGKITGIQPYGAFVALDQFTTGLIHISEISDGYVRDIYNFVHVGDTVRVKIIDFDTQSHQARLSLKAVHHMNARSRRRPMARKAVLPEEVIGFASLSSHLDGWIKKAMEEYKNDEI